MFTFTPDIEDGLFSEDCFFFICRYWRGYLHILGNNKDSAGDIVELLCRLGDYDLLKDTVDKGQFS